MTKQQSQQRFSLIGFAHEWKQQQEVPVAGNQLHTVMQKEGKQEKEFERLVEEIRSELVQPQGRNEEQRKEYSEILNRSVLGYSEERSILLTMIQDMLLKKRRYDVLPGSSKYQTLAEAIFAEVVGLNVLELVMKSREGLEEIQVVGKNIFEVRGGVPALSPYRFESLKDVERIQQNLVLFNRDVLNRKKRWAEAMLSNGSRVTMTGFGFTGEPTLTIRFFIRHAFRLEHLSRPPYDTMDSTVEFIIKTVLRSYFNLVIIGAINTGKTHLIKSMIAELPDEERIVTIESRFEMKLNRDFPDKNIIEYEIDDEDVLHSGRQAFKLALRQSPKRIIHAEIRDDDANVYVRACTRGHEGSMTTVHVNELGDAPDAIVDMCMLDGRGMNPERLRRRITEYVTQIGIEMAVVDGKRKVVRLAEFIYTNGDVHVQDIVRYDTDTGQWACQGSFSEKAARRIRKHDNPGYEGLRKRGVVRL